MPQRPNILFIMTDQQRYDALGCTGGWVETPHLDRIAARGTRFDCCYTNAPQCVPTRLSLATGCYPHTTGVWVNSHHCLSPHTPTWMQAVRAAGYRTSLFGKTHLHPHTGDLRDREHLLHAYGLDDVDEIGGPRASRQVRSHMTQRWEDLGLWQLYRDDYAERFNNVPYVARPSPLPEEEFADVYVGQRAKAYLNDYQHAQPWCCWVSFGGPHEPWDAPQRWAERYADDAMPPPIPRAEWMRGGDSILAAKCHNRPGVFTPQEVGAMRANYAGKVSLIDDQIGQLLAVIEARGELDTTAIVFTSDHGEHNGDAGLIYKDTFLDASARIPMIVSAPGQTGGTVADTPCELIDVGPTIAELAGTKLTYRQFGRSLLAATQDPSCAIRDYAVSEFCGEMMLATPERKLLLNASGQPYALLDRLADHDEQHDLRADPVEATKLNELRLQALDFLVHTQLHEAREFTARDADLIAPHSATSPAS
ncbi:MAG: sulfatase-like hydrolase/transferase [Planctomycetota bacterium]|nr:sulfatase-like hydrolase/transferase [Planctomycetota bacterium]